MTLTVVNPAAGHPMGYGASFLAHSSTPLAGRETLEATLRWLNPSGALVILCRGSAELSAGSGNADIVMGVAYYGDFLDIGASDPRGAPLGATVQLVLTRAQYFGPNLETVDIGDYFTHDPVSQCPRLLAGLLSRFHDPMLDEILASVKRTY